MSETIRVLHVDDDPELTDLVSVFITRKTDDFEVETAPNVSEGLARLTGERFDCIVSDYEMPRQDGLEFLDAVRDEYPNLPFILFTGKGSEEVASEAISAGVTDYLQKGGVETYELLANRIRNAAREYETRRFEEIAKHGPVTLLDRISDGFLAVDANCVITYANEEARELFGNPDVEMVGASAVDLFPEVSQAPFYEDCRRAMDENEPRRIEEYFEPLDRWYRGHIYPSEDGASVVFHEITDRKEYELELQRKERRYQAIFNDPNILVGLIDTDGTVLDINQRAMEYTGVTFEYVVGTPFWETPWFEHSREAREEVKGWIDRAADGEYVEFEADRVDADGESYIVQGVFRPVRDDDGEVVSLIISSREVTEQKERKRELEQTNAMLSTLFEAFPAGVLLEDADRNVLAANEQLFELFSMACGPEEVIGGDCEELAEAVSDTSDSERFVERINEIVAQPERVDDEELAFTDGRMLARSYRPVELPEGDGHLWVYRDVSDRKERERALQEERDRLEEFASIVSHDLRSPLQVASGRLELARGDVESEHLSPVADALDQMERIIDSMLVLAREGQNIGETQPVKLRNAVEDAWPAIDDDANLVIAESDENAPSTIEADRDRLYQLLENLFRNALDHAGEKVTVRAEPIPGGFAVEDDGPGIPEDEREVVFDVGYSTSDDGVGFGLAIVERVAEGHGWNVRAIRSDHGGARFEITGAEPA